MLRVVCFAGISQRDARISSTVPVVLNRFFRSSPFSRCARIRWPVTLR